MEEKKKKKTASLPAPVVTFALGLGEDAEAGISLPFSRLLLRELGWSLSSGPIRAPHVSSPGQQAPGSYGQRAQLAPASPLTTLGPAQRTGLN